MEDNNFLIFVRTDGWPLIKQAYCETLWYLVQTSSTGISRGKKGLSKCPATLHKILSSEREAKGDDFLETGSAERVPSLAS